MNEQQADIIIHELKRHSRYLRSIEIAGTLLTLMMFISGLLFLFSLAGSLDM